MRWWAGGSLKNPILTPRGWSRLGWLRSPPHDHLIDGPFSPRLGTGAPPHQRSQPHRQSGSHKQKAVYARALWVKKVFCPVNSSLKYNYIFPPSRRIMSPNFLLSCFTSDFRTSTGRKKGHFHGIFCWIFCPNLLRLWILWWRVFNDGLGRTRSICQHSPARLLQLLASHNNLFFPCWLPRRVSRESFMPIYSKWDKPAAADETLNFYSLHKKR